MNVKPPEAVNQSAPLAVMLMDVVSCQSGMSALQDVVPSAVPVSAELVPQVTSTIPDGLEAMPRTVTDQTGKGTDV